MDEGFSDAEIRALREWIATSRRKEELKQREKAQRITSARRRSLVRRREGRAKSRLAG